ncbi:MAG TPA: NAD(P)/FAD-dependent oxidoreductase [Cyclobacteriaceae bacterium]|jgi:all-trans-retinol 13,14-reductase
MDTQYDVVIIGSGMGGLVCGTILAKEGFKVCILEKNQQIGGTLQTFVRKKVIFDSGVHYVGGLEPGQNLYQIFKYLGIMDKVKIQKMDEDGYDVIIFENDEKEFRHPQGYENFINRLSEDFPEERAGIIAYCNAVKETCKKFPLYNLRTGGIFEKITSLEIDTKTIIESFTNNAKLQNVLASTNLLYAGEAYKTPFYIHALIINSYIESSYRFIDGGSQIGRFLAKEIIKMGGQIFRKTRVTRLIEEKGEIKYALTEKGDKVFGKTFISNLHPGKTLELTESRLLKPAYRHRIEKLENTMSTFLVNVVMKKNAFPYRNYNVYYFENDDVWEIVNYKEENWPLGYAMFFSNSSKSNGYADGISLMAYMHLEDVQEWADSYNIVSKESHRGEGYDEFKKRKAEILFDVVERRFPGFKDAIDSYYCATPLTLRDYVGTYDGTLYGVKKDFREPMKTFISPRTKIPNLFLTGQNLNLHGVLGVTMSAIVTCGELIDTPALLDKIRNA